MKWFGRKIATKELSKGRWINKIAHAFVKGNMACNLDLVCVYVKIGGMAERTFVAKEDTRASVDINLSIPFVAGKSIDTTSKDAKKRHIGTSIFADLIRGFISRSIGCF